MEYARWRKLTRRVFKFSIRSPPLEDVETCARLWRDVRAEISRDFPDANLLLSDDHARVLCDALLAFERDPDLALWIREFSRNTLLVLYSAVERPRPWHLSYSPDSPREIRKKLIRIHDVLSFVSIEDGQYTHCVTLPGRIPRKARDQSNTHLLINADGKTLDICDLPDTPSYAEEPLVQDGIPSDNGIVTVKQLAKLVKKSIGGGGKCELIRKIRVAAEVEPRRKGGRFTRKELLSMASVAERGSYDEASKIAAVIRKEAG